MKWSELRSCLEIVDTRNEIYKDFDFSNIMHHSGRIEKDGLFVAIPGKLVDGHNYINSAKENGAKMAIVEEFMPVDLPQVQVRNARIALAQLANKFYDFPSKKMKIVGITATNGKTTTSFMLSEILKNSGLKVGIIGTVEIKYGETIIPSELTTPESIDLQKYLNDMYEDQVDVVIMEVSSSAQELYRNYGIDFDIVSFHNISKEHIEQHGSYEKYFESKSKLIREADEKTAIILNIDFPELNELISETQGEVFTISSTNSKKASLYMDNLDLRSGKGKFDCITEKVVKKNWELSSSRLHLELGVAGFSSVLNSLVAICISKLLKIEDGAIIKSLRDFSGVERRFELIYDDKYRILDDHFANLENIEITMQTLQQMKYKDLYIIYAIRGNRGIQLNEENADLLCSWIEKLQPVDIIITKSTDVTGPKDQVSIEEEKACRLSFEKKLIKYNFRDKLSDSVYEIMPKLQQGDALLLAGCQGMDKGAGFVWSYLLENEESVDPKEIKKRIENRVC